VGDYKGQTGLSPPAAYPDRPWERVANKGNLKARHHVYAIDYCFSPDQTPSKDSSPKIRTPATRTDDDPTSK
jgi:hypothetical protein